MPLTLKKMKGIFFPMTTLFQSYLILFRLKAYKYATNAELCLSLHGVCSITNLN